MLTMWTGNSDLIASPIKESIKEQFNEDEEEEKKENINDIPFSHHHSYSHKLINRYEENGLFSLHHKVNDLNLDSLDKPEGAEFPMDIDDGLAPWNSLNMMNEDNHKEYSDKVMDDGDWIGYSMDVEIEQDYYLPSNFISNNMLN